jgi:hypothetical protein
MQQRDTTAVGPGSQALTSQESGQGHKHQRHPPSLQSIPSSLVSSEAAFWRPLLLIHPLPPSSLMQASTKGSPVRPDAHLHPRDSPPSHEARIAACLPQH